MVDSQIYDQVEANIWSDNLPPQYRLPKFLSWGSWLLGPLQWLHDLIFFDYYIGSSASNWVSGNTYAYGDRVKYTDGRVYEVSNTAGVTDTSPITPATDTDNWFIIQDTWIGLRERTMYNSQTIMLEYILNKYFEVGSVALPWVGASHVTQIYIVAVAQSGTFWLSNGIGLVTYIGNVSGASSGYIGNSATGISGSFTIYVPNATLAAILAIQPSGVTAEDAISAVADKYVQMGKIYSIVGY